MNADIQVYCWSSDGKLIAYVWREIHAGDPEDDRDKETESHFVVCDSDGKNQKTIMTEKGAYPAAVYDRRGGLAVGRVENMLVEPGPSLSRCLYYRALQI